MKIVEQTVKRLVHVPEVGDAIVLDAPDPDHDPSRLHGRIIRIDDGGVVFVKFDGAELDDGTWDDDLPSHLAEDQFHASELKWQESTKEWWVLA